MSGSVSQLLSEANQLYIGITKSAENEQQINKALGTLEKVTDIIENNSKDVFEDGDEDTTSLTPTTTKIVKTVLESVLGFDVIKEMAIDLRLEDGSNKYQTRLITESVKSIMVDFWFALKKSFNDNWAKLKTWYITVASASEAIVKKANEIKAQADMLNGVPEVKSFELRDFKFITLGGKIDSGALRKSLETLKVITEQTLNARKTTEMEKYIDSADNAVAQYLKSDGTGQIDTSWIRRFNDVFRPPMDVQLNTVTSEELKNKFQVNESNAIYQLSSMLPGGKAIVFTEVKDSSTLPFHEQLALIDATVIDVLPEEEFAKQSVLADTLYPPQISDICKSIIDLNDQISFYEKAWQRRDKFMEKTISQLDKAIDGIAAEGDNDKLTLNYKLGVRSVLDSIKRSNGYNASLLNMVIASSAGALNYCQASLAMFNNKETNVPGQDVSTSFDD